MATAWCGLGQSLLTRPLWMDELHSWLLITDASSSHALAALADGADYNPPTYYLVGRSLSLFGPVTEVRLRLLSLFLTAATALAVYLILSRRFSAMASVGATLLAVSHSQMILQSTETRFYALWVCLLMWYCWLLTKQVTSTCGKWSQRIVLGILVTAICTTHYFGIISVGLVTVAWMFKAVYSLSRTAIARGNGKATREAATASCPSGTQVGATCFHQQRQWNSVVTGIGLLACAVVAVACCLPMLSGQKAALTCATWVKPPTIASSIDYVWQFVPLVPLGLCCGAAFAGWFSRQQPIDPRQPRPQDELPPGAPWSTENSVLLALMLMPMILVGFSWIIQPALVNRYAIVAVFGMVSVYAWLLSRATEAIQNTCVGIAAFMVGIAVHHGSGTWEHNLEKYYTLQAELNKLPADAQVVFEDRIDFWMLQHLQADQQRGAWYQADFEADDLVRPSNLRTVQRDVGRRTEKWYPGVFPMKPLSQLNELQEFHVVPYVDRPFGELRIARNEDIERVGDQLYRVRRTSERSASNAPERLSFRTR